MKGREVEADRASGRIKAENPEKGRAQGDATGGSVAVVGGGYGYNLTKTGEQERKEGEGPMAGSTCSLSPFCPRLNLSPADSIIEVRTSTKKCVDLGS